MLFEIVGKTLKKYDGQEKCVAVPEGIETISDYAFYSAKNLESVLLPTTLKEIGSNAFYDCKQLQEINLPQSVEYLGSGIFVRCHHLKKVTFSDKIETLPKITFFQCENLKEVILPKQLKRIQRAAFQQCHALQTIKLPSSLEILGENAFDDCIALEEISLPEGLRKMEDDVFFQCSSLKEIGLPTTLETIGKGALETRGKIKIISHSNLKLHPSMFDHNWNFDWNFGANGRYNGKNEENYQFHDSFLPNIDLDEWKKEAQCILCINYLETYQKENEMYDTWINHHQDEILEKIIDENLYNALLKAAQLQSIDSNKMKTVLNDIEDVSVKAKMMQLYQKQTKDILDLFD